MASQPTTTNASRPWRRRTALVAAVPLTALTLLVAPPARAAEPLVPVGEAKFEGHASGTFLHTNVLPPDTARTDLAEANAAVRSQASGGLTNITSALGRPISTADATKFSSANANAAHIAVLGEPVELVAPSASKAPPNSSDVQDLGPVDLSPVASASAVHSETAARFVPNDCVLGADLSFGQGRAALVGALTPEEPLAVTQVRAGNGIVDSQSRTRFVRQTNQAGAAVGTGVGLLSRSDVILAPVNIGGVKIEVGGTFRLEAVATGVPGAAYINTTIPNRQMDDVLTITLPEETEPLIEIPLSEILDPLAPLTEPVLDALAEAGIADIDFSPTTRTQTISPDGTLAMATADLVRVTLLGGEGGQVNIGHAEVKAQVPLGGIACPGVKITKVSDKEAVTAGDTFKYTITVTNPYDCRLTNVKLVDTVSSTSPSITFKIDSASGNPTSVTDTMVTWNDIGPIDPMKSATREINLTLTGAKVNGKLIDDALVTADCAVGSAQDLDQVLAGATAVTTVPLTGKIQIQVPQVNRATPGTVTTDEPRGELPKTGVDQNGILSGAAALVLASLAGAGLIRRRKGL